jgi:hypothetical protein
MNFKRNILGSAVFAAVASLSMPAISADLNKPDALNNVASTAPAITTGAFTGTTTYTNMSGALNAAAGKVKPAADAAKALSDNAKLIATSQANIVAAKALAAGSLIGGKTKAEIIVIENGKLGQSATGVATGGGLLGNVASLQASVTSTAAAKAAADADVAALTAGTISADIAVGLQNSSQASDQTDINGAVTDAASTKTLGSIVKVKTDALGVATAGSETGLYAAKKQADAAVVTATSEATTNGSAAVKTTVAAVTGVKGTVTFTAKAADKLDIRDGDTQLTMTVGSTTADNRAALITKINAETGFSFTASAGTGADDVVLTYDDTATTITSVDKWSDADTDSRTVAVEGNTGSVTKTDGISYKAGSSITYGVALANAKVAAAAAATDLSVGISAVTTAKSNFDTGVALAKSFTTVSTASLTAAAAKLAVVDSVLLEEIAVAEAAQAKLEKTAVAAEAITTADLADVTTAEAALTAAKSTKTAAQAAYDAAVATYIATPTSANATAMSTAQTALATATVAQSTAATAATAATDVLYGAGKTAATALANQTGSLATSSAARKAVTNKQLEVAGIVAAQSLQSQIAGDAANPAKALQASLVKGTDTGGGVVAAVNSNYQLTKTNAAGIATNVTSIATNTTNIATNTTNIATNTTNIATNTSNIATNAAGISSNTAGLQRVELQMNENVDMLKSGIASALAVAGMPTAPGEGMGFSIGTGYFDGESAVAMGLTFVDGNRSFKVSFGHSGSETSASAGAAFKF